MEEINPIINITLQSMLRVGAEETVELQAEQLESKSAFLQEVEQMANPFASRLQTTVKPIKARGGRVNKLDESTEKGERLTPLEVMKNLADQYQHRNPELKATILKLLREGIKPDDKKEAILEKVKGFYTDLSLQDEALEFLIETSEGLLHQEINDAKQEINRLYGREITAGRNISSEAREAAEKGLGTPTSLRDLYRDITGNPRDSNTLFNQLSDRYPFPELRKVADFLLHALGADLKAKASSLEPGKLYRLITDIRSLQAILGIYNFFRSRMKLVDDLFAKKRKKEEKEES